MKFPSEQKFVDGIKRWHQTIQGGTPVNRLHGRFLENCRKARRKPELKTVTMVLEILKGKRKLKCGEIPEIFEIFDIKCVDLFFDFCEKCSLDQVKVIRRADWSKKEITQAKFEKCELWYVSEMAIGDRRTRLDRIKLKPRGSTVWNNHNGHEFLYVTKGIVTVAFSETEKAGENGILKHEIKSGEAVAFPSGLYHRVWNSTAREAEVVVARPSLSLPVTIVGTR